jgi:hypothetical protein
MSSLIPGSCFIQEAMHLCCGFVFVGLALAVLNCTSDCPAFCILR